MACAPPPITVNRVVVELDVLDADVPVGQGRCCWCSSTRKVLSLLTPVVPTHDVESA